MDHENLYAPLRSEKRAAAEPRPRPRRGLGQCMVRERLIRKRVGPARSLHPRTWGACTLLSRVKAKGQYQRRARNPPRSLAQQAAPLTSGVEQMTFFAAKNRGIEVEGGNCSQSDQTGNYSSFHLKLYTLEADFEPR